MTKKYTLTDEIFKDNTPENTVAQIKGILRGHGIETEEIWHETQMPYCFSLDAKVKGTTFATHGKGLTREFALASAYGELMERLQLGYIGKRATQKDGTYSINDSQDLRLPAEKLLHENRKWYQLMADRFCEWIGGNISADEVLTQFADSEGNVEVTPYVNLMDGQVAYIPTEVRKGLYTANGCAAGNTLEEAIVQATSEIVERHYRLEILFGEICVPEIPDETLQKYKAAYDIISYLRNNGYKVTVKDCSLGERFPVVCVCYINKATGKYHTHFGAYPNFEIALERALTETFQGRKLDSFAQHEDLGYTKSDITDISRLAEEMVVGTAQRSPDFFAGEPRYAYNENVGFKSKNNKALMKECIEFFREKGYDMLVRNASGLGFTTCQIIVPGYSETCIHRISKEMNENRNLSYAVKTLRNPSAVSVMDMMGLLKHLNEMQKINKANIAKRSFLASAKLMAKISKTEENFLLSATLAYVYYTLGKYEAVEKCISQMIGLSQNDSDSYLICLKRYISMLVNGYTNEQIKRTLEYFHSDKTVEKLYGYVNNGKNPLEPYVLHCDLSCTEKCALRDRCCQRRAQELIDLVNEKTRQLDIDSFVDSVRNLIAD